MRFDVIAQCLDLGAWKGLVDALYLLQARDVGRAVIQPVHQIVDAGPHAVDVPGGDFHAQFASVSNKS